MNTKIIIRLIKLVHCFLLMFTILLILPNHSFGDDTSNIPGAFADIGLGAGPMGMAGSNVVLVRDVYAVVGNPAGLSSLQAQELAFSMTKQFSLVPYYLILFGQSIDKKNKLGGAILTSGDDVLRENTLILSYARYIIRGISAGVSLKYHQANFGNNSDGEWVYQGYNRQVQGDAKGIGFDIGFRGSFGKKTGFGILLKNAISSINYNASNNAGTAKGGSEKVPASLIMGLGIIANRNMTIELNFKNSLHQDTNDRVYIGVEQKIISMLKLRGGYSNNVNAIYPNRHYALGFNVSHKYKPLLMKFSLDFAYIIHDLSNFYHIGLKITRWRK